MGPRGADRPTLGRLILLSAAFLLGSAGLPIRADPLPLIRNSYGTVGLIDMPTARMAPDGDISFAATYFQNSQRYDLGFQALPWLEADVRYSGLDHFLFPEFPVYWDRSFAMKARLWQETDLFPSIAVGINDLVGTGVYSSEYLVGSKQFGDLDFSLGIGWGRLGSTATFANPFGAIFQSFRNRPTFTAAGGANFNTFFHGPNAALFGGVAWKTPLEGLSLVAEYSSDDYTLERESGNFVPRNQISYAAAYRITDSIELSVDWLYGRAFGGTVAFDMNPVSDPYPQRIGPTPPPAPAVRSAKQQQEALNLMLGRRKENTPKTDFKSNAELVDALWRQNRGLVDVAVEGHILKLAVAYGDLSGICQSTAHSVGLYSLTIKTISVSNGPRFSNCAVAASPTLVLLGPNLHDRLDATYSSTILPAAYITIDAATEPEPDAKAAIARIRTSASRQSIIVEAIGISGAELTIYYTNSTYFSEVTALDRLTRLLMADAPPEIEKFRMVAVSGGVPLREFDVLRAPAERSFAQDAKLDFRDNVFSGPALMQNPVLNAADREAYPNFSWDIFPQFRQELFDPVNPLGVQFLAAAAGSIELLRGLSFGGELEANIWDNFNVNRPSDSVLPHVRTDFTRYFTEGRNGIGNLEADYQFRLAPNVFAIARAGYLESMFAGIGGEILWRPEGQRWALGGDLYQVEQRGFDRLFGLQSYHALTGHIALYYTSPWYGLNFVVRAGQYLAQDRGVTLEISRRFSTGVEVGAFMTKTNVSSAQFGEGSFDKGLAITIPIGWVAPINTQSEFNTVLRPVQRDGGQRLVGDAVLYDETRRTSEGEIINTLGSEMMPIQSRNW